MRYLIDSAAPAEIEQALAWGACGITANPSMYLAQNVKLETFLQTYAKQEGIFLSGEVLADTAEEMVMQAERIGKIDRNIVIKINCSEQGLEACKLLTQRGFRCAMTLIFTVAQAVAAMNAGAAYVFPFVGRTDQY
ncbi:MAG: transaldolase family protein, partial [Butyricicoccus sp.]